MSDYLHPFHLTRKFFCLLLPLPATKKLKWKDKLASRLFFSLDKLTEKRRRKQISLKKLAEWKEGIHLPIPNIGFPPQKKSPHFIPTDPEEEKVGKKEKEIQ